MKITKVCCQGCGADLQIDETIRYVTCNYCHARLEIVHDETITHSRQLDKIQHTTDQLAGKLKVLELQNDIEHLDREWEKFRNSVLTRTENGQVSEPSSAGSILAGIIGLVVGILWIVFWTSNGGSPFALVGLLFIGIALFGMKRGCDKAELYRVQSYRYSSARKSLLQRLDQARSG
ncbi:MAG: hypothetical protein ABI162_18955 [Luteolibacter sp.]